MDKSIEQKIREKLIAAIPNNQGEEVHIALSDALRRRLIG